jgi:hypothetical protein
MRTLLFLLLIISTNIFAYNDGNDRRMVIRNQSSYDILEFRASNVGRNNYGSDRLGRAVLYPGEQGSIDLDDNTGYCLFDFKIVTSAGVIRRNNVNVCEVTLYTIYD